MSPTTESPPKLPVGLIIRVGTVAVVLVAVVLLISGSRETRSVTEVIDEIHALALRPPDGGLLGPWWVSALSYDAEASRLRDFKIDCEPVHLAARSARVVVNHTTDTFHFEMWDVIVVRAPEDGEEGDLLDMDRYILGPIPYGIDIVPDKGTRTLRPVTP